MSLEEKLRMFAQKGELIHVSLAFNNGRYKAVFAAASPPNGYASGEDADPVKALEQAFEAAPSKVKRAPASKAKKEITATVTTEDDEP